MSDLISRKEAIDSIESHLRVVDELYPLTRTDEILNYAFEVAASCVYNLPSAEPISKSDLIELQDRYGDEVRFVVEDMLSGEGKRWTI